MYKWDVRLDVLAIPITHNSHMTTWWEITQQLILSFNHHLVPSSTPLGVSLLICQSSEHPIQFSQFQSEWQTCLICKLHLKMPHSNMSSSTATNICRSDALLLPSLPWFTDAVIKNPQILPKAILGDFEVNKMSHCKRSSG